MLSDLLTLRDKGDLFFAVWRQDGLEPKGHVLAESYPAIFPIPEWPAFLSIPDEALYSSTKDKTLKKKIKKSREKLSHARDAWKVCDWAIRRNLDNSLMDFFEIPEQKIGRVEGVSFQAQIEFEGWIFGVK